jgi:2,3-bisphosphoglycerate-dependent phosphoglycerate mutase
MTETTRADKGCSLVLLVRHAQAEVPDEQGRYLSGGAVPLSERGSRQARLLAESLRGLHVDRMWSSDLLRAAQTAEHLAAVVGVSPAHVKAFREVNCGLFDGATIAELRSEHPEYVSWVEAGFQQGFATPQSHFPADLRFPDGESVMDMAQRAIPAFLEVCDAPAGHVSLVVSHAWVICVVLCYVLGLGADKYYRFGMPNAGMSVVRVGRDGRGMLDALSWQAPLDRLAGASLKVDSSIVGSNG